MIQNKPSLHNLHNLLPTQECRAQLSEATGIPLTKINNWLDPDSGAVPKADSLVIMAKYFNCSVDYLLDLSNIKQRPDNVKKMIGGFRDPIDK